MLSFAGKKSRGELISFWFYNFICPSVWNFYILVKKLILFYFLVFEFEGRESYKKKMLRSGELVGYRIFNHKK
jgi:hypothetical protein